MSCKIMQMKRWEKVEQKEGISSRGAWLEVDEENKKVRYQTDPSWMENTNDD